MARAAERTTTRPTSKAPRKPRVKRTGKPKKRTSSAARISELEQVIQGLEQRLTSLGGGRDGIRSAVTGASNHMGEVVADTLTDVVDRLRDRAFSVAEAARLGTGLLGKVTSEVEKRPFMTVLLAVGIGFLAGIAGRAAEAPTRRH